VFIGGTDPTIEFDIATKKSKLMDNSTGAVLTQFVATPDGRHLVGLAQDNSAGALAIWNPSNDSFTQQGFDGPFWTDLTISADGSKFAAVEGNPASAGVAIAFFDGSSRFTNTNVYPDLAPPDEAQVQGALYSTSGKTLLSPLADSIDFFDTESGTLRGRLLTPELLPVGNLQVGNFHPGVIALDPNQQTIYAISASGLSVMTLPTSVDQISPFAWPYAAKPPSSGQWFSGKSRVRTVQF
jgi:hypothetical protein